MLKFPSAPAGTWIIPSYLLALFQDLDRARLRTLLRDNVIHHFILLPFAFQPEGEIERLGSIAAIDSDCYRLRGLGAIMLNLRPGYRVFSKSC